MSYQERTDDQLVETLLTATHAQEKAEIAVVVFQRYCEKCDRRIRAVLQSRGLDYSDRNTYYNTIFFEVYERVFEANALTRKLQSYDMTRGTFARWLLRVVTSETIDWLRRIDPKTGLSNALTVFPDNQTTSSGPSKKSSWPNGPTEENHHNHVQQTLSQLSDELRVTMRLRFLGYCDLEPRDISYLSEVSGQAEDDISTQIRHLQQEIRNSGKFLTSEQQQLELAVLTERVEYFHRKIQQLEPVLETLGYSQKELVQIQTEMQQGLTGNGDTPTLHYQDINNLRSTLRKQYAARCIEAQKFAREEKLLTYQEAVKRWLSVQQKKEQVLQTYRSGAQLAKVSYEQIAALMGISAGTVASRINRAKKTLEKRLSKLLS